jgi:hypothetical protein
MEPSDELRRQIRQSLKPLHPEKVIVFGSYAHALILLEALRKWFASIREA